MRPMQWSLAPALTTLVTIACFGQEPDASGLPTLSVRRAFPALAFRRPIQITHAGDETNRLFIVEQNGRIRVFANDRATKKAGVFLDISEQVRRRHNEEGLLSLAFHPDYATNGRFYVYYSASEPRRGVLSEFRVDGEDADRADPASERVILEIDQPYGNHNGSTALFGPDGYLYFSLGDGGWANDPLDAGQDLSTMLATIVRIDVDRTSGDLQYAIPDDNPFVGRSGARGEIWAYGLRNIWRMSFDRKTGDLWAGDVGQNRWEEIDLIVKGGNYGWNIREGKHHFADGDPTTSPMIDPVVEYSRSEGISVTGGHVYRGKRIPGLVGVYVYADYVSGRVWGVRMADGVMTTHGLLHKPARSNFFVSSFGEDEAGEIYLCCFDHHDGRGGRQGRVYEFVAR